MVNTDDFIKRLEIIMDSYGYSSSLFADKIGVQRSSLSHLLSGRNKPSLDFVMKIISVFPEVDLYWILNGKGDFPKKEISKTFINENKLENFSNTLSFPEEENVAESTTPIVENLVNDTIEENEIPIHSNLQKSTNTKSVERIVIFYKDGTFSDYKPN